MVIILFLVSFHLVIIKSVRRHRETSVPLFVSVQTTGKQKRPRGGSAFSAFGRNEVGIPSYPREEEREEKSGSPLFDCRDSMPYPRNALLAL